MVNERAKQFLPFQSLKGLEAELRKREKVKIKKKELSLDQQEELSYQFNHLHKGMLIRVVYYENEEYLKKEGIIVEINEIEHYVLVVKDKIKFNDIFIIEEID
jgi:hypothetical protein